MVFWIGVPHAMTKINDYISHKQVKEPPPRVNNHRDLMTDLLESR